MQLCIFLVTQITLPGPRTGPDTRQWPTLHSSGWPGARAPNVEVFDDDDQFELAVELPGMDEKDVNISLTGNALTIRGEKKAERKANRKGYFLTERSYGGRV